MGKLVPVRFILAFGLLVLVFSGCARRLDEQQVRARLTGQVKLQNDRLRVVSLSAAPLPVARLEYGGVPFEVRFRRQEGVWVIEAVRQDDRWEAAEHAVPVLAHQLEEKSQARWVADAMPRYARTLKLLTGWADLLSNACGSAGLPTSRKALLDLHGQWHRVLFPNRGTEFHNADLFVRDAWLRPLRTSLATLRADVQSSGADARMDTADDVRMVFEQRPIRAGINACMPHYTLPAFVADALGRPDAPQQWNCSDLVSALKRGQALDVVEASR